jgi:hypothetical protein
VGAGGRGAREGKHDALRVAVQEQTRRGIDIVSDGEQTRQHFVTTFIEHLSGVDFAKRETVRIRDRYDASVPTVVGEVRRERPVFVDDARFLRERPIVDQMGAARPDDDGRHALRRALQEPREAGVGVRDDPQRGGARSKPPASTSSSSTSPRSTSSSTR